MKDRHLFATLCTAPTNSDLDDSIVEEIFADEVFIGHIQALNYLVDQAEGAECKKNHGKGDCKAAKGIYLRGERQSSLLNS